MLTAEKRPYEAVFISDLHLNPAQPAITERFNSFIDWAACNTRSVYILGDFFHAWPGDDSVDPWTQAVTERLLWLSQQKVSLYFMHGNRDFLVGSTFARNAGLQMLQEPSFIDLHDNQILLAHGDCYCTKDKGHQWLRRLTRNHWFAPLFMRLPLSLRIRLVSKVRQHSQANKSKTYAQMDVVPEIFMKQMHTFKRTILIHGHTHKPGLSIHEYNDKVYSRYVLSDWDDTPLLLCYNETMGFEYTQYIL